jgi:murein L,D-transpeptidase YcbB/YkuD
MINKTRYFLLLWFFPGISPGQPGNPDATIQGKKLHPQFYYLNNFLKQYSALRDKGGWPMIRRNGKTKPGTLQSEAAVLKKRLLITGELKDSLDIQLETALKVFQKNHGLKETGRLDNDTRRELDIPVAERIKQIKINMDRWANLPAEPEKNYIFVNTAAFKLDVMKNNLSVLNMKVVVGKAYRKTPVFISDLTCLEFNPYWYIPPNITRKDILPKIKNNYSFIKNNSIKVLYNNKRIDSDSINWARVNAENNPYKFIQSPGGINPMGVVAFIFPNKYNVYMHDTPFKNLFEVTNPTFSSGCIRLSKAIELAVYILKKDKGWDKSKVDSVIGNKKTTKIFIESPVKVYIQYFTAWVDGEGALQFVPDIYKRDNYNQH